MEQIRWISELDGYPASDLWGSPRFPLARVAWHMDDRFSFSYLVFHISDGPTKDHQ